MINLTEMRYISFLRIYHKFNLNTNTHIFQHKLTPFVTSYNFLISKLYLKQFMNRTIPKIKLFQFQSQNQTKRINSISMQ
jgi:hypothetical protein